MKCCRCVGKGYTLVKKHHQPTKRRFRQSCGRCCATGIEPQLITLYDETRVASMVATTRRYRLALQGVRTVGAA